MPITIEQLTKWSRRPSSLLPGLTVDLIRDALKGAQRLQWQPREIYVQGSYANKTNISANSDVDLVIQLEMPFEEQLDALKEEERERFFEYYAYSDYGWEEFRADVEDALRQSYFVEAGNRCVTVKDWDSVRVPADILPAIEFRRYRMFGGLHQELYDEGVFFRDKAGTPIINYPRLHLRHGILKDRRTIGRYKEIVRIVKNARLQADCRTRAGDAVHAPSYFIECLLFKVPDYCYRVDGGLRAAYAAAINWLDVHQKTLGDWLCQNGIVPMFGGHPEAWKINEARALIEALKNQFEA